MEQFKEVSTRVSDNSKYIVIHALSKQGFKAKDIVEALPSNLAVVGDTTTVTVNSKVAKLNFEESKVLAKYINTNMAKIKEYKVLFFGKGPLNERGLTKAFRTYLQRFTKDTLQGLGWNTSFSFESMDDMQKLLNTLNPPSEQPKKAKKTVE